MYWNSVRRKKKREEKRREEKRIYAGKLPLPLSNFHAGRD